MIQELTTIAFQIAIAGNKSRHPPLIFHRYLHKFAVLQKRVHPGVVFGRLCGGRRVLTGSLPAQDRASQQPHSGKHS
jgi:hypothetical protein